MAITTTTDLRISLKKEPATAQKIAELVQGRDHMDMTEINDIVANTKGATRLIPLAYPRVAAREGATVQMATARLGVNRVISVMVQDILTKATIETFTENVGLPIALDDGPSMHSDHGYIVSAAHFAGEASGVVTIIYSVASSLEVAASLCGGVLPPKHDPNLVNDKLSDLVYFITGKLVEKLGEAQLPCEQTGVVSEFSWSLPKETVPGGSNDILYFREGSISIGVHLGLILKKHNIEEKRQRFGIS